MGILDSLEKFPKIPDLEVKVWLGCSGLSEEERPGGPGQSQSFPPVVHSLACAS